MGGAAAYAPQLFTLLGVWALAVISPGPNFLATSRYAIARSRRDGVLVGLGATSGLAVWITLSLTGLSYALTHAGGPLAILRWLGALYLIWLGVLALWSAARPRRAPAGAEGAKDMARSTTISRFERLPSWVIGFLTSIGNPRALVFFGSIFALLLPARPPLWLDATILLSMLAIAAGWFSLVALLFSLAPVTRVYRRAQRWIDAVTGAAFIALGLQLVVSG